MKREEFVARHIEEYLEGKDDDYRRSFLSKPLDRQYGTLQTWKRRKLSKEAKEVADIEEIIYNLKCCALKISNLPELNEKNEARLLKSIDSVKNTIEGYKETVRQRKLKELKDLRSKLDKEISELLTDVN
ncbi:MAG: hypothetical protein K2N03_03535 [Muribaculaceae bacterium]|nr:hypothetical protein [Muribaculaceae bacterium]